MRTQNTYSKKHNRGALQTIIKIALFAVLFSLVFSTLIFSINSFNFAEAEKGVEATNGRRAATAIDVSEVTTGGKNFASDFNTTANHNSTYAKKFGLSSEDATGINNFGWNSAEEKWGMTDWADSDVAIIWWLEFTFSSTALTAVKNGQVSFYASATCDFSDGTNDESTMAINYVGVQNAPTVAWIDTSRTWSAAAWTSTGKGQLPYNESWSDSYSRTISYGATGGYNTAYKVPTTATGIRMIFACIADGAMDGGFTGLNLTLYKQPSDSISSTGTTFSMVDGLYGDQYTINATSTSNWTTRTISSSAGDFKVLNKVAYNATTTVKYTGTDFTNDIIDFGKLGYASAGLFAGLGDGTAPSVDGYTEFSITLPPGVTKIDFSASLFAGSSSDSDSKNDWATASVQLYNTSGTAISGGSASAATGNNTGKEAHTKTTDVDLKNMIVNSSASNSNTTMTVRLRLVAGHENDTGNIVGWGSDDNGNAFALIGKIKIRMYGRYTVSYNRGSGTGGTMSTSNFIYGVKDATETLRANTFTYADHTFVGWSTTLGGSVVYTDKHDTSNGATGTTGSQYSTWTKEITKVPNETVTLYAVWRESDFGALSGKTKDSTWGSSTNPFVISEADHWLSLVDIVNGNRDPVDSVTGTYYGKSVTTSASDKLFTGCYFALTKDVDVGDTVPVGKSSSVCFKGILYGGEGTYADEKKLKTLNVEINSTGYAGLFYYLNAATIEYIGVKGTITTSGTEVGGIVGEASGTTSFKNCVVRANIIAASFNDAGEATGKNYAGGIVGYAYGAANITIENCEYIGGTKYTATDQTGAKVIEANIFGGSYVGGMIGIKGAGAGTVTIRGCSASGTIVGTQYVGGIGGYVGTSLTTAGSAELNRFYNSASVKATGTTSNVGGIFGHLYYNGTTSTANAIRLQYAYNCGTVTAAGANAGGIVGNTALGTNGAAANILVQYCYNAQRLSYQSANASTTGEITGTDTNTTRHCWAFKVHSGTTANFNGFSGSNNTSVKYFVVALSGASILPSTYSATDTDDPYDSWTKITKNNFTYFRATGTLANNNYLRIYNAGASNALVAPSYTNFIQNNTTDYSSTFNTVFYAYNFTSSSTSTRIAIEAATVTRKSSPTTSKTYDGENAPDYDNWITLDSNPYANAVEIEYSADGTTWVKSVKDVNYDGSAAKPYSIRLLLKNGTKVIGVNYVANAYTINRRSLSMSYTWGSGWLTSTSTNFAKQYVYNGDVQRLISLKVAAKTSTTGVVDGESLNDILERNNQDSNVDMSISGLDITITTDTVDVDDYRLKLDLINTNYMIGSLYLDWTWTIQKKSFDNSHYGADDEAYDVLFGYNGVASGAYTFNKGGLLHALDMRSEGKFFTQADSPYALVFKDNNNKYTDILNYNLYYLAISDALVRDTDYTLEISGGTLSGNSLSFGADHFIEVVLTYTGIGNYKDTRYVRFTLMDSDFGGNCDQANWGSDNNPYLIQNNAHLARLGQIVAGAPAWNSISDVNANAVATDSTYSGTFFFVTANVEANTGGGFVSIGKDGDHAFSATFNGKYNNTDYTITLAIDESRGNVSDDRLNYTGLFGYLKDATVLNITTVGTVKGVDYVGGIAGYANVNTSFTGTIQNGAAVTGRNFVGGIGGEIACALSGVNNGENAKITGMRAVGGIVGHLTGSLTSSANRGEIAYLADLSEYNDGPFIGDGGVSFNGLGGIVGFINTRGVMVENCINHSTAKITANGAYGAGGIVGYANVSSGVIYINATTDSATENRGAVEGMSYLGGIVGYAKNVSISENCSVSAGVKGTGADAIYAGGYAGKWVVTDISQMQGQRKVVNSISIVGVTYVGGVVGWLDAHEAKGLRLTPYITNGDDSPIEVKGKSYVGALYGGFEGYGYKRNTSSATDDDTLIYIDPSEAPVSNNPYIYVSITLTTGGRVAGGLFGYVSGAGIMFLGDWVGTQHTPFTFEGKTSHVTNFFGGIVGVLGENATLESAKREQGNIVICAVPHTVAYRDTSASTSLVVGGDFVGSIAGYIASTAGVYISSDTTLMGNYIQLYNDNEITANSYVGGIFGALGKKSDYVISGDIYLQNLVRYGNFGVEATGPNSTLRYAPSDDNGLGKLYNYRSIIGKGNYVGGIIGYVGDGALISFVNPSVDGGTAGFRLNNITTYLNVYNGYGVNPSSGDGATIRGANYVGGIAGYLSSMSHELVHAVSLMLIMASSNGTTENGNYAGGLFGYMGGGSIVDSLAISGYSSASTDVNYFMGNEYVGGIVGMLGGGRISGSISRGFKFASVSLTKGGIAGSISAGATIESSWTFYLADTPTYATVSKNTNGNYVIIDKTVISGKNPMFSEYARMIGLFTLTGNSAYDANTVIERASKENINQSKAGFISLSTALPTQNNQLVFYDVSGNDVASSNTFETLAYQNRIVYYRFSMTTTANFSICVRAIEFSDIKKYDGADDSVKKQYVAESYERPSANDIYSVDVTTATFTGGYIKSAVGNATYPGKNPNSMVILGTFNKSFTIGDSSTPYVITTQTEWNDFATAVRTNKDSINGYNGKYVKLDPKETITVTSSNLAGVVTATTASSNNVFKGTFDGNGNHITVNISGSAFTALSGMSVFPGAAGATFKNLTIKGNIKATGNALNGEYDADAGASKEDLVTAGSENVAAFVAKPLGSLTFKNCTSEVNIETFRTAGGFVATSNGYRLDLITCVNKGNVTTKHGLSAADGDRANYANYDYGTGGLVGIVSASGSVRFESCKNEGVIQGGHNVGGIVGYANGKGTSTSTVLALEIFNSANTNSVTSHLRCDSEPTNTHALSFVGGLVGKTGNYAYLRMYSSFNSGKIVAYGSIVGGLAGGIGEYHLYKVWNGTSFTQIHQGGHSIIAYCYNNGEVHSGGTTSTGKESAAFSGGWTREALNGSIVGGIVGILGSGSILYCYNTGGVYTHHIVGEYAQWQLRIGGILGQAQPNMAGAEIIINYCYNLGLCHADFYEQKKYGIDWSGEAAYGASICGFMDAGDNWNEGYPADTDTQIARLQPGLYETKDGKVVRDSDGNLKRTSKVFYNYVLKNNLWYNNTSTDTSERNKYYSSVMEPSGTTFGFGQYDIDKGRFVDGTIIDSVADFTTYLDANGNFCIEQSIGSTTKPYNVSQHDQASSLISSSGNYLATYNDNTNTVDYDSSFLNGEQYGYIYVYGCLPQLAVFALDTKEGLSMLSVSYGQNDYGKFVGNQAGSKESPYVIKDGVDLLAVSALNRAKSGSSYYTFKNKYIEFADGTNNIEGLTAKNLNMNMSDQTTALKSSSSSGYSQSGKNYFLYGNSATSGQSVLSYGNDDKISASTLRTNWCKKNHYFTGTSGTSNYPNTGTGFTDFANFYPIGNGTAPFEGNISGLQGESGNTEIRNLHISVRTATNSYAGLFGSVFDATISNISVAQGNIYAYVTSDSSASRTFAGGIAGYAGGNTRIENCQAGSMGTSYVLNVTAFASTNSITSPSTEGYAGGIVGAAGPSKAGATVAELKTLEIVDCRAANANVSSARRYIGGIVGYAGNPWNASTTSGRGNYVNITNAYVYCTTLQACESSTGASTAGTDTGGIVGANDGNAMLTIYDATVGAKHPKDPESASNVKVAIYGEHSFGGIIGTANGNTSIGNVTVTANTTIARKAWGTNVANFSSGLYHTSIGGIIGKTKAENSTNTLRDSIKFAGEITVEVKNSSDSESNPTGNIGGVIGAMGTGTRFLSGSAVVITGKIKCTFSGSAYIRNIGGIAGATIDGAFDGTFDVKPEINAPDATNVGGFIGRNFGVVNILASDSGTTVNISANITGKSQVGGLVGLNGYEYADGTVVGTLMIGADAYLGGRYEGQVAITVAKTAKITASGDDAGGIFGSNIAFGSGQGVIISKGVLKTAGTVSGNDNVGGIVGNNQGNITMGGSTVAGANLEIQNSGTVSGNNNVGGVIGYLQKGSIAGIFANIGSVEGSMFVGGSIGRVDKDAVLTVGNGNTYFYNGAIGRSADEEVGTVTGTMYVGGSIGGMLGKVEGSADYIVRFINEGEVNGQNFMGGNIGLLAGTVNYSQFTNSGSVSASGTNAIGGSVGFVGILTTSDYQHQPISVKNTHFEFVGINNIEVSGTAQSDVDDANQGGIGGAVGVIGNASNDFDNDGSLWQNVTLYTSSGVSAPNVINVGGAIGLIKANNIVISNMLAFYTTVTGKENVGGIVGAVTGHNVKVLDSFNIEGTVSGITAGGIIGLALTDGEGVTVADTSYWVKGFVNAELMALDIDTVVETLGRYVAVSDDKNVFTEELTTAYGTPAHYTGNDSDGTEESDWAEYLKRISGKNVTLVNGVWAYAQDSNGYTTGLASTGWYYVFANDVAGLDTTHISAADNQYPSVLAENEREQELKYWKRIAKAYTAEDMVADENGIIAATEALTSPIAASVSGTTVTGNGAPESGHIYAAALESQVSGYYLYMDASGVKPTIYYGEQTNWNNTGVMRKPFYLDAKTSLNGANDKNAQNVAIYYRSVGVGGTLIYNGYKRYVPITDDVGMAEDNESVQLIKYMSSEDLLEQGNVGDYVYTMTNIKKNGVDISDSEIIEAGKYTMDVQIYFYDAFGKYGKIGGFEQSELRIETLGLANDLTPDNGSYNGDDTTGSIVLTIHGIAPLDNGVNKLNGTVRSVKFNISGENTTSINGVLDIGALMVALGGNGLGTKSFGTGSADRALAKNLVTFTSDKIYLSEYTVSIITDAKLKDTHWDTKCINDDSYSDGTKPYSISVKFRFTETIEDNFIVTLDDKDISRNYNAEELKEQFAIKPKLLELKLTDGAKSAHEFDGNTHDTLYVFEGWVENHQNENRTQLIQSLLPYLTYTSPSGTVYGDASTSAWTISSSYTLRRNNITCVTAEWLGNTSQIRFSNMKLEGKYNVAFATNLTYEVGNNTYILTEGGNYYVKLPEDDMFHVTENSLRMTWSTDNSSTYDAQYRWLVAEFTTQQSPFYSAQLLADEMATLFPDDYDMDTVQITAVSESTVKVGFRVGPNAGTHNVVLPEGNNAHTENCAIDNPMSGSYTINKLDITIGLSGNDEFNYNGGFHKATGISATCANELAKPQWTFNSANGEYVLEMFASEQIKNDVNDNKVKVTLTYNGNASAVNAGTYNAEVKNENITFMSSNRNFNITASGSGTLKINPAKLTLTWTSDSTTFTYDKAWHGRGLNASMSNYGSNFTVNALSYTPTSTNSTATMSVLNATNHNETFTIPVGGTHAAINASADNYVATVNVNAITISGTNAAGTTLISNYEIVFTDANNGAYKINKRVLKVTGMSGHDTSKIYDATTKVVGNIGTPQFQGSVLPTSLKTTAAYDNPNVGTNKTITYTIELTSTDKNNFVFENGTATTTYNYTAPRVTISLRQLIIRLDRLRNSYATKTYDGTAWFGGLAGAKNSAGKTIASSAVHRSGEGFTVYEIAADELTDGAVVIKAVYKEAVSARSAFDSYVNNVVGSGADILIGTAKYGEEGYFYKDLVFSIEGDSAANYSFIVSLSGGNAENIGDVEGNSSTAVTVSGETSDVKITITPYTVRANYGNIAQSYATAQNTYNTDWLAVTGSAIGVNNQILTVSVTNNWMYQNNNPDTAIPATYKSYTVIRGAENSVVLSARLANSQDGAQVNYRLSNQPILTIGYFVDKDVFEIGSMASLMLATYYYAVSQGDEDEFGIVISQAQWNLVVSAADYENGTGNLPSSVVDEDGNTVDINSWDEYFAWLATDAGGNHDVFLNESTDENGWGYYSVDDSVRGQSYDKFKQIANVSGVLTQQDIAILNGMFNKVTIDSEGNVIEGESYTWGVGGDYLTNFVKLSEGNVATAIGAIFTGEFAGEYNGNGYTIDGINIIGVGSASVNRFGMFEKVKDGKVQNVHLRNFNLNVNASGENTYIGAIAGEMAQTETVQNVSVHATITANVNGRVYAGGLFGISSTAVDGAIVLGEMNITATRATVGGAVGENRGASVATHNAVSLMQISVQATTNATVAGIVGSETSTPHTGVYEFMQNAVWSNGAAISGGKTYTELYNGSVSGYAQSSAYYYTGESGNTKGNYDVLNDVKLTRMDGEETSRSNARESMRLADIIDIYVLMYSKVAATTNVEGVNVDVFDKSEYSWLVGTTHGTDNTGDAIQIANQQGVALLRELRFATFELKNDVRMYSTYTLQTVKGAFYGKVKANGHAIYIATWDGTQTMFESELGEYTPTAVLKNN